MIRPVARCHRHTENEACILLCSRYWLYLYWLSILFCRFFCRITFFVSRCKHNILISVSRISPLSPGLLSVYNSYMYTLYPEYWQLPTACAGAASVKWHINKTNKPFNSITSVSVIHDFIIIVDDCIHQSWALYRHPSLPCFTRGIMPAWYWCS